MEPASILAVLKPAIAVGKGVASLEEIILGKFGPMLSVMSDIHLKAAARALNDRSKSIQPRREIESALTHLRLAYEAEEAIIAQAWGPQCSRHLHASSIALMIATSYSYLQEPGLVERYCEGADQHYCEWHNYMFARASTGGDYAPSLGASMIGWWNNYTGETEIRRKKLTEKLSEFRQVFPLLRSGEIPSER